MTRLNRFALAFAATALLSACAPAPQESPAAKPAEPVQETLAASTETRQLAIGETLDIELQGTPGTGYAWELVQDGAPTLRQETVAPAATDTRAPPIVGGPETLRWRFVGAQAGKATVLLVYRRPWERDVPPVREARYDVDVR